MKSRIDTRTIARTTLLAIIYYCTAKFGLSMHAVSGFATLVWPPSGISLAALLLWGYRLWPGIALAAFLVNVEMGAPLIVALGMAIGNTLEALIGTYLLNRIGFHRSLDRVRDVLGLVVFAAFLSTLASGTIGVASLYLGGVIPESSFRSTWTAWWLGDVMGALIVAPFILVFSTLQLPKRLSLPRVAEGILLATLTLALILGIYFDQPLFRSLEIERAYMMFPILLWGAVRFHQAGAVLEIFVIAAISIYGTAKGFGPFSGNTFTQSLTSMLSFLLAISLTGMILAAVTTELRNTQDSLKKDRDQLEQTVISRTEILRRNILDLQKSEERFRIMVDSIKDYAIFIIDPKGTIVSWNRGAERLTGYTQQEVIGRNFSIFFPSEELTLHEPEIELAMALKEGRYEHLAWRVRKDSSRYWANIVTTPMRDLSGRHIGFVKISRDLSERKKIQELEEIINERDEFMSVAAHELRTPVTSFHLQLQALRKLVQLIKLPSDNSAITTSAAYFVKLSTYITRSEEASRRVIDLLEDLLNVSRIRLGKLTIEKHEVDLIKMIEVVLKSLSSEITRARVKVSFKSPSSSIKGKWDSRRIEQVITNLLSNALKYGGGKPIEITATEEIGEGKAKLVVTDHGIGISQEAFPRIFERFERGVPSAKISGLGLGLYIAKQIVSSHGGVIYVASKLGIGSSFTVELPTGRSNGRNEEPPLLKGEVS